MRNAFTSYCANHLVVELCALRGSCNLVSNSVCWFGATSCKVLTENDQLGATVTIIHANSCIVWQETFPYARVVVIHAYAE